MQVEAASHLVHLVQHIWFPTSRTWPSARAAAACKSRQCAYPHSSVSLGWWKGNKEASHTPQLSRILTFRNGCSILPWLSKIQPPSSPRRLLQTPREALVSSQNWLLCLLQASVPIVPARVHCPSCLLSKISECCCLSGDRSSLCFYLVHLDYVVTILTDVLYYYSIVLIQIIYICTYKACVYI